MHAQAQLTLTQYIGDTQFSFVSRIAGTFIGAVIGLAMWYIANGSGTDSAYGMAAVFAVVLPFLMAARLWYHTPVQIILVGCFGWVLCDRWRLTTTHRRSSRPPS